MKEISRRIYYLLLVLEGFFFAIYLLQSDKIAETAGSGHIPAGIFYYLLISMTIILTLGSSFFLIGGLLKSQEGDLIGDIFSCESTFIPLLGGSLLVLLECVQDIFYINSGFYKPSLIFSYYESYREILLPSAWLGLIVSLQTLLLLLIHNPGRKVFHAENNKGRSLTLVVFLVLLASWLVLALTDLGYIQGTADEELRAQVGRFLPLTNPITGLQAVLIGLFSLGIVILKDKLEHSQVKLVQIFLHPLVISLVIWGIGMLIWSQVPIEGNYLVDFPEVPAKTIYPNSDAFYFAKEAQRFLAGVGFEKDTTHVLYTLFLSGILAVAGDDYKTAILLQYAVVALAPVLLYWLVRKMHSPLAGLISSFLFLARERNGLLMGEELAGPLSSEFLSENLALVGLIGCFYLIYSWVERPGDKRSYPWIAGSLMGVMLLIRADFLALFLAVAVATLIVLWKHRKLWLRGMTGMALTMLVIITPWMVRNWQNTGVFYLDKGTVIQRRLVSYYEQIFKGETSAKEKLITRSGEYDLYSGKLTSLVNHLGNNLHQSILYLPNSYHPFFGIGNDLIYAANLAGNGNLHFDWNEYTEMTLNAQTRRVPYYWFEWDGRVDSSSIIPVGLVLLAISVGLVRSWQIRSWKSLIFIFAWLAHCLVWAFVGFSGNRFIKTIDWVPLVFFSIGFAEILAFVGLKYTQTRKLTNPSWLELAEFDSTGKTPRGSRGLYELAAIGALLLIGLAPTIVENIIPFRYSAPKLENLLSGEQFSNIKPPPDWQGCLEEVREAGGTLFYGRALYPRYYAQGEILGNDRRRVPLDPSYPKINFYLVGSENAGVTIPDVSAAEIFPHGLDVLLGGIQITDDYIRAVCVLVIEENTESRVIFSSSSP